MHCLYDELPSASHRVSRTRAAVVAHRYELDVLRYRTFQSGRYFQPIYVGAWNGLPDSVFESGLLGGFNRWLLS